MTADLHEMLATRRSARQRLDRRLPVPVEMLGEFVRTVAAPLAPAIMRLDLRDHASRAGAGAGAVEAAR